MTTRPEWHYPVWVPPPPVRSQPSRAYIAATTRQSDRDRQLPVAAEGSIIPVVYGRAVVNPSIFAAVRSGFYLYLGCAWCLGEIDDVVQIYDGEDPYAMSGSVVRANYTGSAGQGVDPDLDSIISGYNDDLVFTYSGETTGVAYSVLRLIQGLEFPSNLVAVIDGRKVRDPRGGAPALSSNPALCLADFIESPTLGLGIPVNDQSLEDAADYCDQQVSGKPRHTINLAITQQAPIDRHLETLRAYANCWLYYDDGEIFLVPQRSRSIDGNIGMDDIVEDTLDLQQLPGRDQPTVVTVAYTSRSTWPWVRLEETVKHVDVDNGNVPWRESTIDMPGIHDASEARRLATQRLNHATLVNLQATLQGFDELLQYTIGDVVQLTHDVGLSNKRMRVINSAANAPGRWQLTLEEYDSAVYSNTVVSEPTWPDTNLPTPDNPPTVTGLSVTEVLFETDKGFVGSRLDIVWDDMTAVYLYGLVYRVVVTITAGPGVSGSSVVHESTTRGQQASTPPLQEKSTYRVDVRVESTWGDTTYAGDYATEIVVAQGKSLAPADVPEVRALEAAGEVYIEWDPSPDLDIWRYEVRYGSQGGQWDSATVLDQTDTLRHRTTDIPEGDWDIHVKAIDSVGQYSIDSTVDPVSVTFDPGKSNAARYDYQDVATVSGMIETVGGGGERCWVSDQGASWASLFPADMDNYDAYPLVGYNNAPATSSWRSETYDWQYEIEGNWNMPRFDAYLPQGGFPTREMELRDPGGTWYDFPTLATFGRYKESRAYAQATGGQVMVVCLPTVRTEVSSTPKSQSGQGAFDGASPTRIELPFAASAYTSVQVTPIGSSGQPRYGVVDNIQLGVPTSFDVFVFASGGGLVASNFFWEFRGF